MGERRWRASQEAGRDAIPAIVRETDDNDMLRDALLENLHRSQLNPLEEAAAYGQLLEDFGCTHEELPSASAGRGRRSPTRCVCSSCRPPCSAGSRPACCPPGTPAPCSASTTPASRTGSRHAGHGRGHLACAAWRRSSPGRRAGRPARAARNQPVAPGLAELADRLSDRLRDPGEGRPRARPRARSPSSSPASTTCGGSSTSWTPATATTGPYEPRSRAGRRVRHLERRHSTGADSPHVRGLADAGCTLTVDKTITKRSVDRSMCRSAFLRFARFAARLRARSRSSSASRQRPPPAWGPSRRAAAAATRSRAAARRPGRPRSSGPASALIRDLSSAFSAAAFPRWGASARRR